jgi:hypothetical protein
MTLLKSTTRSVICSPHWHLDTRGEFLANLCKFDT